MEGGQDEFPATTETAHQLKQAAGIGGNDCLRLCVEQMPDLAVAELLRGLRLQQVVDACGAAAERWLGDLGDFELRNLCEQMAWLLEDALRVTQVAGVVIRDAHRQRISWRNGRKLAENLCDVFALCGEGGGTGGPFGVVAEQVAVLLHRGAAAGSVDDDGIDVGGFEHGDDVAGHRGGLVFEAGVDHQGPAAGLILWRDDLAAFSGEHARGGGVDVGEEDLLDASGQHADAAALCCTWCDALRHPPAEVCGNNREEAIPSRRILRERV